MLDTIHNLMFKFYLYLAIRFIKPDKGKIYFQHILVWKYKLPVVFNVIYLEETTEEFIFYCDTYPRATGNLYWYGVNDFIVGSNSYTLNKPVQYESANWLDSWVTFTAPKVSVIQQEKLLHQDY